MKILLKITIMKTLVRMTIALLLQMWQKTQIAALIITKTLAFPAILTLHLATLTILLAIPIPITVPTKYLS